MFQPFIDDTVVNCDLDGATDFDFQREVAARHQLSLPLTTVRTLLSRAVKKELLRRDGGRYFEGPARVSTHVDLKSLRAEVERRQAKLADDFRTSAQDQGSEPLSREIALQSLMGFIERHHVRLALDGFDQQSFGVDTAIDVDTDSVDDRLAARFLRSAIDEGGASADAVAELLEGYVLQNTLLLTDVSTAERKFSGLRVFFDSTLLFGALGMLGDGQALLTVELLALLKTQGATPAAFSTTLREMRRVLAVYEQRLGTAAGRRGLYPTDLTRHFLRTRATPSDVRAISSVLDRSIESLGITVSDVPTHVPAFTLDEAALGTVLADRPGGEHDPRVVHDIDCIAGVLTIRRGRSPDSLDMANAVFASSSKMTIENSVAWYERQGGTGVPPIVHFLTVSNLAWLKRPAGAATLKLAELVALCSAALRPTRKVWNAFLVHLDRLEKSGEVTSDEVGAIMASSLTDRLLANRQLDEDPDADSLTEVVERVKASLNAKSNARVAKSQAKVAQLEAREAARRLRIRNRSIKFGAFSSWFLAVAAATSFALGTATSVFSLFTGMPPAIWSILLGAVPLAVGALFSVLWGFNVITWQRRIAQAISESVDRWLNAED
jgi:hypothetical protein